MHILFALLYGGLKTMYISNNIMFGEWGTKELASK